MEYYLPTYEEAKEITIKYDDFQFYEKIQIVDGFEIRTFNYRLVGYNDFFSPIPTKPNIKAFELRGLSFVFNKDGSLYKRYLLMNKFFNLNQVESTQYDEIKHLKIVDVQDKADGSVINFVELPNGKILAKSKMQVDNEMALASQSIFENDLNINKLVKWSLLKDIMPIFEYVSPQNRIVLKYKKTKLILLKFRCLKTGKYLDLNTYPDLSKIEYALSNRNYNWDDLDYLSKTSENIEGWVITLEDGMLLKKKTDWYFKYHKLSSEFIHREDFIIKCVVENTLDDIITTIDLTEIEILSIIRNIENVTNEYIKNTMDISRKILNTLQNEYLNNKKDFISNYGKKDKYLTYVLKSKTDEDLLNTITEHLLRHTYRLEKAREFIKQKDF